MLNRAAMSMGDEVVGGETEVAGPVEADAGDGAAATAMEDAAAAVVPSAVTGFDTFAVGQAFEGKVVSAKQFGVFVDIGDDDGHNALIPRSVLTRGSYEKLKSMVQSDTKVNVELIGINNENQTISAKYIPANFNERVDISTMEGLDLSSKFYEAVVVSAHDFGVFAELDAFGVEGLVPASKMPEPLPKGTIQASYKAGDSVTVKIEQLAIADKKLVLSMNCDPADKNPMSAMPHTKWFQGIVQNVASFGLFVRPAGFDCVGLVHHSRVPRGLTTILKKSSPVDSSKNQTDCEQLFTAGDVVRCRVHAAPEGSRKIELSMLPFISAADEDDNYVVEGRDPEEKEGRGGGKKSRHNDKSGGGGGDAFVAFDPEDTLLWWRGAPYEPVGSAARARSTVDQEMDVVNENAAIVEGTWRRMFEVDMREDEKDFTSKVAELELKELEEEIGELSGLDEDLVDTMGFGEPFNNMRLGSFVPASSLPAAWRDEIGFFEDLASSEDARVGGLKQGKSLEQDTFEKLLREVESELDKASSSGRGGIAAKANKEQQELVVAGDTEDASTVPIPVTAETEPPAVPADEVAAPPTE
jgi:predicted RNA-binding protein with RPS1 domain